MLQSYYIRNYKAFRSADIIVRPLTLLLGPNNTGKTSLTEILLLMQQTAVAAETGYAAPLRINGRIVSLGAPEHLFHNKSTSEPLVLGFRFLSPELTSDLHRLQGNLGRDIYSIYRDFLRHYDFLYHKSADEETATLPDPKGFRISLHSSREMFDPDKLSNMLAAILQLRTLLQDSMSKRTGPEHSEDLFFSRRLLRDDVSWLDSTGPDLEMASQFTKSLNETPTNEFSIEFEFRYIEAKPHLQLSRLAMLRGDQRIADITMSAVNKTVEMITSDLLPNDGRIKNYRTSLSKLMSLDSTVFSTFEAGDASVPRHLISRTIADVFGSGLNRLMQCFTPQKLSHVSPIRAYPKRFYLSDQANAEQLEGDNYIEALRDNTELRIKANQWLSRFGINVSIEQVRDVLHRAAIKQEGVDVDLDILDVGFGVSQVLPVLIQAFLAPQTAIAIVEQPEIHLHPKMQAELLDFFLDIIVGLSSTSLTAKFILETHSVALLRRLRTRLVQRQELADSVAIYSVERFEPGCSSASMITIDESGSFKWPYDFLEAELSDTMQFLAVASRKEE